MSTTPSGLHRRTVTVSGHRTSVALEPVFWEMLRDAAHARGVPVNAIVAQIDVERLDADEPTGLASAIRQWLVGQQRDGDAS